ncbi:MAG: hypothetical protein AAB921_00135, partial [Patescibacteria group bacterium]
MGVGYVHAHSGDIAQGVSGLAKDASPFVSTGADKAGDFFDAGVEKVKDIFDGKDAPAADSVGKLKVEVDEGASTSTDKTDASPTAKEPAAGVEAKGDAAPAAKAEAAPAAPVAKADAAPTAPDGLMAGVEVKPGQGFGEMIVALRGQIPDDIQNPSPAL